MLTLIGKEKKRSGRGKKVIRSEAGICAAGRRRRGKKNKKMSSISCRRSTRGRKEEGRKGEKRKGTKKKAAPGGREAKKQKKERKKGRTPYDSELLLSLKGKKTPGGEKEKSSCAVTNVQVSSRRGRRGRVGKQGCGG